MTYPNYAMLEAKRIAKEQERKRKEEERKVKAHNQGIRAQIEQLKNKREKLKLEHYAKARALSRPHFYRDEETAKEYGRRIKDIEKETLDIDDSIRELKKNLMGVGEDEK